MAWKIWIINSISHFSSPRHEKHGTYMPGIFGIRVQCLGCYSTIGTPTGHGGIILPFLQNHPSIRQGKKVGRNLTRHHEIDMITQCGPNRAVVLNSNLLKCRTMVINLKVTRHIEHGSGMITKKVCVGEVFSTHEGGKEEQNQWPHPRELRCVHCALVGSCNNYRQSIAEVETGCLYSNLCLTIRRLECVMHDLQN